MTYVYILETVNEPRRFYIGTTTDLRARVRAHTAKLCPWRLRWYCAFPTAAQAEQFERYLKSASGRAFSKRHL